MNLKPEELVKALRCTSALCGTTGECETCPYYRKEQLNDTLREKLGMDIWTSCDTEEICMEAANQIERDQKEIAELKAKVEQYRALIPSWVIPMTPKEDADGTADL